MLKQNKIKQKAQSVCLLDKSLKPSCKLSNFLRKEPPDFVWLLAGHGGPFTTSDSMGTSDLSLGSNEIGLLLFLVLNTRTGYSRVTEQES